MYGDTKTPKDVVWVSKSLFLEKDKTIAKQKDKIDALERENQMLRMRLAVFAKDVPGEDQAGVDGAVVSTKSRVEQKTKGTDGEKTEPYIKGEEVVILEQSQHVKGSGTTSNSNKPMSQKQKYFLQKLKREVDRATEFLDMAGLDTPLTVVEASNAIELLLAVNKIDKNQSFPEIEPSQKQLDFLHNLGWGGNASELPRVVVSRLIDQMQKKKFSGNYQSRGNYRRY